MSSIIQSAGYSIKVEDEKRLSNEVLDLQNKISEKMLMLQGTVMELQRLSGKHVDFNEGFYKRLEATEKAISDINENIEELLSRLKYVKELLDALKLSQEIADGYKEFVDTRNKKQQFDFGNLISGKIPIPSGIPMPSGTTTISTPNITIGPNAIAKVSQPYSYESLKNSIEKTIRFGDV